ncbi:toxin-antitoxin system, toxin component [Streptomyces sp. RSD-27]|nr:toxin-antitoxin system, toxin component [Streptomyces sp. RSD-27]
MAESTTARTTAHWGRPDLDLSGADWQPSSRGAGDLQIAFVEGFIAMRDSDRPDDPSLVFAPHGWRAFVLGARAGRFDLT